MQLLRMCSCAVRDRHIKWKKNNNSKGNSRRSSVNVHVNARINPHRLHLDFGSFSSEREFERFASTTDRHDVYIYAAAARTHWCAVCARVLTFTRNACKFLHRSHRKPYEHTTHSVCRFKSPFDAQALANGWCAHELTSGTHTTRMAHCF